MALSGIFFFSLYVFFYFQLKTFSAFARGNSLRPRQGRGEFLREDGCGTSHCQDVVPERRLGSYGSFSGRKTYYDTAHFPPSRHGRSLTGLARTSFHNTFTGFSFKGLLLGSENVERVYCLSRGSHRENMFTVGNYSVVWHQEEENSNGIAYKKCNYWVKVQIETFVICQQWFSLFFFKYCYCLIITMLFSSYCTTSAVCV